MNGRAFCAISIEKHVLIVDEPNGAISGLMSQFDHLGYRVIWVPTTHAALTFLKSGAKLSLLVASAAALENGGKEFLARVKELEPRLRVISGVRSDAKQTRSNEAAADTELSEPFQADELRSAASRLLAEHFQLQPAADALTRAALEILGTVGTFRVVGGIFLKANQTVLSDFSAMIPFSGGVSGHLMMSITTADARELHQRFVPSMVCPTLDRLEDLVGELCNQILGRIAARFADHALSIEHTTPIFIRSMGTTLRYRGKQPSLGLELSDEKLRVFTELYLEEFDGSRLALVPSVNTLRPNELHFF
jgi:CheY-specific phosphatase CheX